MRFFGSKSQQPCEYSFSLHCFKCQLNIFKVKPISSGFEAIGTGNYCIWTEIKHEIKEIQLLHWMFNVCHENCEPFKSIFSRRQNYLPILELKILSQTALNWKSITQNPSWIFQKSYFGENEWIIGPNLVRYWSARSARFQLASIYSVVYLFFVAESSVIDKNIQIAHITNHNRFRFRNTETSSRRDMPNEAYIHWFLNVAT